MLLRLYADNKQIVSRFLANFLVSSENFLALTSRVYSYIVFLTVLTTWSRSQFRLYFEDMHDSSRFSANFSLFSLQKSENF